MQFASPKPNMAVHILNLVKNLEKLTFNATYKLRPTFSNTSNQESRLNQVLFNNCTRNTNFFNKLPADHLWKGITSVSNAGKKRGRGRTVSKKNIKDLNRGQMIGVGKANIQWPGLSAPIIRGKELVQQQQLPEDLEREQKLIELRNKMGSHRYSKLSPLDRGWSGSKMPGRSIGPPEAIGENTFEGFDTKVLQLRTVFNMKGTLGRKRRLAAFVITGNKNGLMGFAIGRSVDTKATLRKAKNRAGQKLMHIKIYKQHTVYHDFFSQYGNTKVFVSQRPEGHGLLCHRVIRTMCEVVGIKNLHAKVEGSTNVHNLAKAFCLGLLRQKTHDEIAEEKKLHLVEFRPENNFFPTVLASPSKCRTKMELDRNEILDFKQYCLDGRVILQRKKFPPFFTKLRGWEIHLKKQENMRNHDKVRRNLKVEYGELRSFLTEKFPEAKPYKMPPKSAEEAEAAE